MEVSAAPSTRFPLLDIEFIRVSQVERDGHRRVALAQPDWVAVEVTAVTTGLVALRPSTSVDGPARVLDGRGRLSLTYREAFSLGAASVLVSAVAEPRAVLLLGPAALTSVEALAALTRLLEGPR